MVEVLRTIEADGLVCELCLDAGRYLFTGPTGHSNMGQGPASMDGERLESHWVAFLLSQGVRVLSHGERVGVDSNNGVRPGVVLSVISGKALLEYHAPGGTTSLRIVNEAVRDRPVSGGRSVSYWSVPNKWLNDMTERGIGWLGRPQQSPAALSPGQMLVWKRVRAELGFGHTVVRPVASMGDNGSFGVVFHGPTLSTSVDSPSKILSSCGFEPVERKGDGWQTWKYDGGDR